MWNLEKIKKFLKKKESVKLNKFEISIDLNQF